MNLRRISAQVDTMNPRAWGLTSLPSNNSSEITAEGFFNSDAKADPLAAAV
jgi:hypothetical protein